jgi:hypothetical protein
VPVAGRLDPESAEWLRVLGRGGQQRETALARLHAMLLRIAQTEARRRAPQLRITELELKDLSYQAVSGRGDGRHRQARAVPRRNGPWRYGPDLAPSGIALEGEGGQQVDGQRQGEHGDDGTP